MSKEKWIKAGIIVAVIVAGAVIVKVLPMSWTLSAGAGFIGGVACSYLWRTKVKK